MAYFCSPGTREQLEENLRSVTLVATSYIEDAYPCEKYSSTSARDGLGVKFVSPNKELLLRLYTEVFQKRGFEQPTPLLELTRWTVEFRYSEPFPSLQVQF